MAQNWNFNLEFQFEFLSTSPINIYIDYMLFMKSHSHIWPFFMSHHLIKKKKKKKLVYCNVFEMLSPSVFGINFFFYKKNLKLDM